MSSVAFDPAGSTLASASDDETVKLWDQCGKLLRTLEGHSKQVTELTFDPVGRTFASADLGGEVKWWDPASGKLVRTLKAHQGVILSIAFDPTGATLASANNDRTIKLWGSASGMLLRTLEGHTGHRQVRVRAGIHIGPTQVEEGDVFGGMVNFAARVLAQSRKLPRSG